MWISLVLSACAHDPRLPLDRPLACGPRCEAARRSVDASIGWLDTTSADPDIPSNLDVLVATWNIAQVFRSRPLDALVARLRAEKDRPGEPRRRFYVPDARLDESPSAGWVPAPGLHMNYALVEVLYCPEWGLRPETVDWICAELRDDGGRTSAHAAWFLSIAVDGGCVARASTCLDTLAGEMRDGAAAERPLDTADARDLLAEQILFGLMAGVPPETLAPAVDRLLAAQQPDGGWGTPDTISLHATAASAWSLTEWIGRQQPSVSAVSPKEPAAPEPAPGAPPLPSANPTPTSDAVDPPRQTIPAEGPPPPPPP